jgi:glycosyltransferase involved in cell wall biosynthesis
MTMAGADHGSFADTRREAQRLGVIDRIAFPGYMSADQKREAFATHDVYLNTNIVDHMPVSLLEAAASGLIPVATAVGGIPYLLTDGSDGVLVPPRDDERMANEVLELLDDPQRFARMSASARHLAERSAWPEVRKLWTRELSFVVPELHVP